MDQTQIEHDASETVSTVIRRFQDPAARIAPYSDEGTAIPQRECITVAIRRPVMNPADRIAGRLILEYRAEPIPELMLSALRPESAHPDPAPRGGGHDTTATAPLVLIEPIATERHLETSAAAATRGISPCSGSHQPRQDLRPDAGVRAGLLGWNHRHCASVWQPSDPPCTSYES
ncbi:hypothetical protein [Rhodococcus globerulus]|uniref:hypothetical protein n=1 Tax=Rhodococcus globerulus TaxID=33008 RepID=UPI000ACC0EEC|nr:hypothetical protein [Rhodococcus globerulus]